MKRFFHILISFFLLFFIADCAKIGAPAGGPRDKTPPKIEKSKPLNKTINYKGRKIEITFDEFINTQAISQELIVSPPLEERPEIRLRGKTLVVEWQEDLHDSTTYTFSFGESIKDLNEGNVLSNFEFVFSTGGYLDSLAVMGTVLQAFDLKPHKEKIFLMLHSNLNDSAPLLEVPKYVGKSDAKGNFLINNLSPDTYRLFALQDLNRNYKYDVPEEFIGFLDSAIYLYPSLFQTFLEPHPDSLVLEFCDSTDLSVMDTLLVIVGDTTGRAPGDSIALSMQDSALVEGGDSLTLADLAPWSVFVDVFLFQEDNVPQYLIENSRKDRRQMSMRFNRRLTESVIMEPFDFEVEGDWYLIEEYVMNDTLVYWLTDSLIYKRDSLTVLATYPVTDSLLNYVPFYDTLRFNYREVSKSTVRRRRQQEEEKQGGEQISLDVMILRGPEQDLQLPVSIVAQHPLARIDTSRIYLHRFEDTLIVPVDYTIVHDSVRLRRYFMKVDWQQQTSYEIGIFPGAFTDIYGIGHDTIIKKFRTRNEEYYGKILLELSGVRGQKIIQVLDNKGNVVRRQLATEDGLVEFPYMTPSIFTLKLIHDVNANGKWDTGDYLEHRQPEAVEFYPGNISVRSNFDMEINWELQVLQEPEPGQTEDVEGNSEAEPMPSGGPPDEPPAGDPEKSGQGEGDPGAGN